MLLVLSASHLCDN